MSEENKRADELRLKRAGILKARELDRLRGLHGHALASIIAKTTGVSVALDDFDVKQGLSLNFDWPKNLALAPGLAAPYVGKSEAGELLACIQEKLTSISGWIGFHDKDYLGFARVEEVSPISLLAVSEATEDSVLFHVERPRGIIFVDCYPCPPSEPFSVVVQGADLAIELAPCFSSRGPRSVA
ncbi:MAG: hypothetical protein ACREPD_06510 [Stenotrophomonas sp.]|uniref:hypothetical protein n=1 Tax=Stenotrophomonas sp. TaxID=69392 RepID=UPI003D6CD376